MTNQTPQDETSEEEKQRPEPRDAAYWASTPRSSRSPAWPRARRTSTSRVAGPSVLCRASESCGRRPTEYDWPESKRRRKRANLLRQILVGVILISATLVYFSGRGADS